MNWLVIPVFALVILTIGSAIYAVISKNLLYAVVATGLVSLGLSLFFFILQAPDVALTEAAIGVALTTIIFIITIRNTTDKEKCCDKKTSYVEMKKGDDK
ncbi:MAG: hypothetical protein DRI74_01950 [Bacteroidetes bacterium]|nr:MAG: hypothetical protein DRI74_01950 [Bacteroidota bacterium]